MDYTEKDLKKKLKSDLERIAKTMEGFNPKLHKKKEDLIALILKKERKPSKKEDLMERASKYADFKKKINGGSVAKLEAFLASKEAATTTTTIAKEEQKEEKPDLMKLSLQELRKKAKSLGWVKRTGTKTELIAFIRGKTEGGVIVPEGRLTEKVVVEKAMDVETVDMEEWPVSPEILAKHSKTVDDLKKLLKAKGIAVGLPRTKKEILELFQRSRCSFKNFTCSEDEFCDLRNNICRELNILRNKDNEIKKLAKGLVYIDNEKGRFYGTPDAIAKVRQMFARPLPEEVEEVVSVSVPTTTPVKVEEVVIAQEKDVGISPININRLLDKPSENEIRRAILHCLGLYHDIDPNDEIILSPA